MLDGHICLSGPSKRKRHTTFPTSESHYIPEVALRGWTPEYSAAQTQLTEQLDTSRSQAEQLRMEHAQAGAKCTVFDAELRPVSEGAERLLRALTVAAEALANERKRSEETSGALQAAGEAAGEAAAACSREEAERCREHTSGRARAATSGSARSRSSKFVNWSFPSNARAPRQSSRFVNWSLSACSGLHRSTMAAVDLDAAPAAARDRGAPPSRCANGGVD